MLNRQKMALISMIVFALASVSAIIVLRAQSRSDSNSTNKERPTSIKRGVMTEAEKEHSRIYNNEYARRAGRKLSELSGAEEVGVLIGPPSIPGMPNAPAVTVAGFLKNISCEADAIVIVTVRDKSSQLTLDETFTFTQYEATIEDVLKDNVTVIRPHSNIIVTRPGGAIQLDGRVIRVVDSSFPLLKIGARYLLFVKFIPSTGAYKTFTGKSDFELENEKYIPLSKQFRPGELQNGGDAATLLTAVRASISNDCAGESKGGEIK